MKGIAESLTVTSSGDRISKSSVKSDNLRSSESSGFILFILL